MNALKSMGIMTAIFSATLSSSGCCIKQREVFYITVPNRSESKIQTKNYQRDPIDCFDDNDGTPIPVACKNTDIKTYNDFINEYMRGR